MAHTETHNETVRLTKTLSKTVDEKHPSTVPGYEVGDIQAIETITDDEMHALHEKTENIEIDGDHVLSRCGKKDGEEKRYITGTILGSGGGGSVFNLTDNNLQRTVAVKVLPADLTESPREVKKFMHEALITSRLDHPHIPPIYDLDLGSEDQVYYTMKKIDGVALSILTEELEGRELSDDEIIFGHKYDNISEVVNIFIKIGEAAAYAHSKGIIHRDIKPGNIMVGSYGEVSLVDWGIAVDLHDGKEHSGHLSGTPLYMSPEQANRETADERSDIFCFGTTLYHVLYKHPPVRAHNVDSFWEYKRKGII
ncbi:MAG: serine/threonine protein kinase, partial [Planctomycetes bacterium]|nr:serine/threonine protein kinase [Planctomycetota bacterium]